jgi:ABC-type multidrug transport system ATPase subunit
MIEVKNISKYYGEKNQKILAVDNITFSVKKGEIFGLIGPDGSGKTSIFRMLTTVLLADSGNAEIDGLDVINDYKKIRQILGYMPGKFSLYQDLTVEENLEFFASVFNTTIAENYDLIKDIYQQIEPFKTRRAGKLSGGMKQKLALSCALIHKPKVLFLDEPTTGVDPVSRKEFWEMLKRLKEQGITIVVATPYMDEASLCDRIALMQNGKILKIDTPKQICKDFPKHLFEVKTENIPALLKILKDYKTTENSYAFGEFAHVVVDKEKEFSKESLEKFFREKSFKEIEINKIEATIEDSFILLLSDKVNKNEH